MRADSENDQTSVLPQADSGSEGAKRAPRKRGAAGGSDSTVALDASEISAEESNEGEEPQGEGGQKKGRSKRGGGQKRKRPWRAVLITLASIAAIFLILLGLFSWNRWLRFDDVADFQGQWYVVGTDVSITIDGESIHFDDKTAYKYTLDTGVKTVEFSLAKYKGLGHYWFSSDRKFLVIADGADFTKWGTAISDLGRDAGNLFTSVMGNEVVYPGGTGVIALSREPNTGTTDTPIAVKQTASTSASSAASSEASSQSSAAGSGESAGKNEGSAQGDGKDVFADVTDGAAGPVANAGPQSQGAAQQPQGAATSEEVGGEAPARTSSNQTASTGGANENAGTQSNGEGQQAGSQKASADNKAYYE